MQLADISLLPTLWAVVAVVLAFIYYKIRSRDIFPGPCGLPYLGIWPFLRDETAHLKLTEYSRRYGDIYSFTSTGRLYLHLGSVKAMREVQVNNSEYFSGRFTDTNIFTYALSNGLAMVNGESWKVLRKFFLQSLREYGVTATKENMLGPVYDTLPKMVEDLKARKDAPFNVLDMLSVHCKGTLQTMLFGENGITDEKVQYITKSYTDLLDGFTGANMLLIGPVARLLFTISPKFRRSLSNQNNICVTLRESLKKIESSFDEDNLTCVIEHYFKERNERRRKNDPTWKYFSDQALIETLSQFLGDGIIGTAVLILCFLNALTEHPEEQNKIYDEIVKVIGINRLPTMADKKEMSYTIAFMNEVLRTSIFFAIFPSLECTTETTIRGYRVPKGSITLLNFYAAHHNPETYEDPEKFNPSRFLPEPGKTRPELPVSFGMGKRSCSGEAFVMMEAFLFLTTIVQNFHISYSTDSSNTSSAFLLSGKLEMCFQPRVDV